MCFQIREGYEKELLATEDIICYKRLSYAKDEYHFNINYFERDMNKDYDDYNPFDFISPFRLEKYSLGEIKSIQGNLIGNSLGEIHVGLHSYSSAIHANFFKSSYEMIYECIIPKGSKYYYNPNHNEYVSNQLIVMKNL